MLGGRGRRGDTARTLSDLWGGVKGQGRRLGAQCDMCEGVTV